MPLTLEARKWAQSLIAEDEEEEQSPLTWARSLPADYPRRKVTRGQTAYRAPPSIFAGIANAFGRVEGEMPDVRIDSLEDAILLNAAGMDPVAEIMRKRHYVADRVPFSPTTAGHLLEVLDAAARVTKAKSATEEDYRIIAEYINEGKREGEKGVVRRIADLASRMPGFAIEFLATGGAYRGTKAALERGAREGAEAFVEKSVLRAATEKALDATVSRGGALAAQTALNPRLTAEAALRRQMPEELGGHGESAWEAIPKGFVDAMIEVGSEKLGEKFVKLPMPKKLQAVQTAWSKLARSDTATGKIIRTGGKAGYYGTGAETLEERAGAAGRPLS